MTSLPPWIAPKPMDDMTDFYERYHPLKMYNSLTRSKVRQSKSLKYFHESDCKSTSDIYDDDHFMY